MLFCVLVVISIMLLVWLGSVWLKLKIRLCVGLKFRLFRLVGDRMWFLWLVFSVVLVVLVFMVLGKNFVRLRIVV